MKLHGTLISPFVRMALVTAHELGMSGKVALVESGSMSPIEVNRSIASHNPLGKIPCLVTDHGHPVYDSRVICEYLCHHAGDKALLPDEPVRRFRILTLQALAQGMADAAVAYRYENFARPKELRWPGWSARQAERVSDALADVERSWINDLDAVTAGTIALAVTIAYIDHRIPEFEWRKNRRAVGAFFDRFNARPSMAATKLG